MDRITSFPWDFVLIGKNAGYPVSLKTIEQLKGTHHHYKTLVQCIPVGSWHILLSQVTGDWCTFPKLKPISKIWQICIIIFANDSQTEKYKIFGSQVVTYLSITLSADCLTSVILLLTLTALIVGSCLCLCFNWGIQVGDPIIPLWVKVKVKERHLLTHPWNS